MRHGSRIGVRDDIRGVRDDSQGVRDDIRGGREDNFNLSLRAPTRNPCLLICQDGDESTWLRSQRQRCLKAAQCGTGDRDVFIQRFPAQGRSVKTQSDGCQLRIRGLRQSIESGSRETYLATIGQLHENGTLSHPNSCCYKLEFIRIENHRTSPIERPGIQKPSVRSCEYPRNSCLDFWQAPPPASI